jgi:hypothetical protein
LVFRVSWRHSSLNAEAGGIIDGCRRKAVRGSHGGRGRRSAGDNQNGENLVNAVAACPGIDRLRAALVNTGQCVGQIAVYSSIDSIFRTFRMTFLFIFLSLFFPERLA